jgi:hypothetical protein
MKTFWKLYCLSILIAGFVLAAGCATPAIKPADPHQPLAIHQLAFLKDALTTREEVLLKLGMPTAQFEGERILTYQFYLDSSQVLHTVAPQLLGNAGLRSWARDVSSLVLVFDSDGVLRKHSLVSPQ